MSEKTAEPGSLVVLLRALVMLVFLVGLPGVAVLKGSFPELADRLVERGREALASVCDQISEARGTENAPGDAMDQPAAPYSTPAQIHSNAPRAQVGVDGRVPGRLDQTFGERMTASDITMSPPGTETIAADASGHGHAQPAAFDIPSAKGTVGGLANGDRRAQEMGPVVPLDPVRAERLAGALREMGATYYRLEKWGDNAELFRFQCKMSVGGNLHVNRHFEATDADANRAIEHVVEDVRRWRGAVAQ